MGKSYFYRLLIILVLILLFRNTMFGEIIKIQHKEDLISPYPSNFKLNVNLFYVGGDELLHEVPTTVEIHNNRSVEAIVNALKEESEMEGLHPLISSDFTVLSYKHDGRKLYIDVDDSVKKSKFWLISPDLVIYGFCNSLLSLDNVDAIVMSIEGTYVNEYTSFDDKYGEIRYNDYYVFEDMQTDTPEGILKTFLKLIRIKRFDLAYHLTTSSMRRKEMPQYFYEMAEKYQADRKKYVYRIDKNVRYDDLKNEYRVYVSYYEDKSNNLVWIGLENWKIISIDREFKIIWEEKKLKL